MRRAVLPLQQQGARFCLHSHATARVKCKQGEEVSLCREKEVQIIAAKEIPVILTTGTQCHPKSSQGGMPIGDLLATVRRSSMGRASCRAEDATTSLIEISKAISLKTPRDPRNAQVGKGQCMEQLCHACTTFHINSTAEANLGWGAAGSGDPAQSQPGDVGVWCWGLLVLHQCWG